MILTFALIAAVALVLAYHYYLRASARQRQLDDALAAVHSAHQQLANGNHHGAFRTLRRALDDEDGAL